MIKKVTPRVTGGLKAKRKVEKLPTKPKAGAVKAGGPNKPKRPNGETVADMARDKKRGIKEGSKRDLALDQAKGVKKRTAKTKGKITKSTAGKSAGNAGY